MIAKVNYLKRLIAFEGLSLKDFKRNRSEF